MMSGSLKICLKRQSHEIPLLPLSSCGGGVGGMILFIKLLMGHALADFSLQTDTMAKGKNRNRKPDMSVVPPGQKYQPTWKGRWLVFKMWCRAVFFMGDGVQ